MYLTRLLFAEKPANSVCSTTSISNSDANFQSENESVYLKHLKTTSDNMNNLYTQSLKVSLLENMQVGIESTIGPGAWKEAVT